MEALQWANDKLKAERIGDSPMLDAQVLLAHVFDTSKSWVFTHLDQELRPHEDEAFQKTIARRLANEPVAYIVSTREFYKRPFAVNRFVLIPRPATEILVDAAIASARETDPEETVLADIGTGSGAIAVTLAAETGLPVIASDASKQALAVARQNAEANNVADLVDLRHGDLLEPLVKLFEKIKEGHKPLPFTHLVLAANLPYLTERQWEAAEPDVRDFEPRLALVGGPDGLEVYWNLFRQLRANRATLPRKVTILIEIDPDQTNRAVKLITHDFPRANPRVLKDLEGFDRVVIADV